jgi:exosome complex component RRP4
MTEDSEDRNRQDKEEYKLYVSHRSVVFPGDLIGEGKLNIEHTHNIYKVGNKYYSTVIGVVEVRENSNIRVVPLQGPYIPEEGDIVIGIVEDISITNAILDIRSPYKGILPAAEIIGRQLNTAQELLTNYISVGDVFLAKIEKSDLLRDPLLSLKGKDLGKVMDGTLIEVGPTKVPRIIGKKRSMIDMIISETMCEIIVGNNGRILIRSCPSKDHEAIAINAIRSIETQPYIQGLTEKIREQIIVEKVRRGIISVEQG